MTPRQPIDNLSLVLQIEAAVKVLVVKKQNFTAYDITQQLRHDNPSYEITHDDSLRSAIFAAVSALTSSFKLEWRDYPQPDGTTQGARTYVFDAPAAKVPTMTGWLRIPTVDDDA